MYGEEEAEQQYALAEEAFRRALAINPDLPIAHNLFTALEIEAGRPGEAMRRLLGRVRAQSADPELFAGLVQACRYAGLDRPAIAAYEHARRLDPQIRTAVSHAYLAAGHYDRAIETDADDPPVTALVALDLLARGQEAIDRLRPYRAAPMPPVYRFFLEFMLAVFEKDGTRGRAAADPLLDLAPRDPCAKYYMARGLALIEHPRALDTLEAAVRGGFHAYGFFMRDPWLDPIRTTPRFRQIVTFAEERYRDAVHEYAAAGGERILGPVARD
jgi:tetratricopeptide (TPR) repeat protein